MFEYCLQNQKPPQHTPLQPDIGQYIKHEPNSPQLLPEITVTTILDIVLLDEIVILPSEKLIDIPPNPFIELEFNEIP